MSSETETPPPPPKPEGLEPPEISEAPPDYGKEILAMFEHLNSLPSVKRQNNASGQMEILCQMVALMTVAAICNAGESADDLLEEFNANLRKRVDLFLAKKLRNDGKLQ